MDSAPAAAPAAAAVAQTYPKDSLFATHRSDSGAEPPSAPAVTIQKMCSDILVHVAEARQMSQICLMSVLSRFVTLHRATSPRNGPDKFGCAHDYVYSSLQHIYPQSGQIFFMSISLLEKVTTSSDHKSATLSRLSVLSQTMKATKHSRSSSFDPYSAQRFVADANGRKRASTDESDTSSSHGLGYNSTRLSIGPPRQAQLFATNEHIFKKGKYATTGGDRGFMAGKYLLPPTYMQYISLKRHLSVFEYDVRGSTVMIDVDTSFVRL